MSDLAKKLIADNKRTRATFLDLGNCGLTETPNEIQELKWLEGLSVADSWSEENDETHEKTTGNRGPRNDQLQEIGPLVALRRLKSFYAKGTLISDVSPLAVLSSLQHLDISYTQVTDLTPLTRLPNLQSLDISRVPLADFTVVAKLSHLRALNLLGTQLTDLAPLARLSHLQYLGLAGTPVKDLTPLAKLANLQRLRIDRTQVVDLTPLARLFTLQALSFWGTQVVDLSPLTRLSNLQNLNISGTPVADARPLANLLNLQTLLNISETHITDVTPLANLSNLQVLNIGETPVEDVTPLANLLNLKWLDVSGTPVVDVTPLANLLSLKWLDVSRTPVADITPLEKLLNLETLNISKTRVTDIRPLRQLISEGRVLRWEYLIPGLRLLVEPGIYVVDCALANPPLEIIKQGNMAILSYFRERETRAVEEKQQPESTRTIKIFLASSSELKEDRDAFDLYLRQQNDLLRRHGLYLEVVRWENFLDAMSETRLQDEYNRQVRDCDIFVGLFFTKVGKYTEEEFDAAYGQFKKIGKPRIFTYFRNNLKERQIKLSDLRKEDLESLWAFQERLGKLGHFYTTYNDVEHLKRQFRDQLDKLLD